MLTLFPKLIVFAHLSPSASQRKALPAIKHGSSTGCIWYDSFSRRLSASHWTWGSSGNRAERAPVSGADPSNLTRVIPAEGRVRLAAQPAAGSPSGQSQTMTGGGTVPTQLEQARQGQITEAMAYVAQAEGLPVEAIREKVAAGLAVIPANPNHRTLSHFTAIGQGLLVKVNANLGTSYDYVNLEEERQKLALAQQAGADAVMDLSTGGDIPAIRQTL